MINIKQGDRKPAAPATLKRGDTVVDLTSATSVTFKLRPVGRIDLIVDTAATILVAASGTVEYRWADGDTDDPGQYYAEWEVLWNDDTKETFPTMGYDVCVIHADLDGS
jgi:hypothetical protein